MFTNCGRKIRVASIIIFGITLVLSLSLAISFGWTSNYDGTKVFQPIIFFGFLLCAVSSYISTLFLVAFGDLVEDVYDAKEDIYDIKRAIVKMSREESR